MGSVRKTPQDDVGVAVVTSTYIYLKQWTVNNLEKAHKYLHQEWLNFSQPEMQEPHEKHIYDDSSLQIRRLLQVVFHYSHL